jgi:hypothetical protein
MEALMFLQLLQRLFHGALADNKTMYDCIAILRKNLEARMFLQLLQRLLHCALADKQNKVYDCTAI